MSIAGPTGEEAVWIDIATRYTGEAEVERANASLRKLGVGQTYLTDTFKVGTGEVRTMQTTLTDYTATVGGAEVETKKLNVTWRRMSGLFAQSSIMLFVTAIGFRQMASAQERVRDAQYRLNAVMEKYGAGSKEVLEAQRNLTVAQTNLNWATIQFGLQMFLTGLQAIALIGQIKALTWAAISMKLAFIGGPLGLALIGVGAIAALGAAYYFTSQVNIQGATTDQIEGEWDRMRRNEKGQVSRAYRGGT